MPAPPSRRVVDGLERAGWIDEPVHHVFREPVTPNVARVHLDYGRPCRRVDGRNPDTVILKWPEPEARAAELAAYERLADVPAAPTPRSADVCDLDGIPVALLLHDVSARGAPADDRMLKLAVDRLARLHAAFWAGVPEGLGGAPSSEVAPGWARAVTKGCADEDWCAEVEATLAETRSLNGPAVTLVHGELSPDHVLPTRDDVRFVHWSGAHAGYGVVDLAMLLGSAVSPVHGPREWDLVLRYHASLLRAGVMGYGPDEAWSHYQWAKADALRRAVRAWEKTPSRTRETIVARLARSLLPQVRRRAA